MGRAAQGNAYLLHLRQVQTLNIESQERTSWPHGDSAERTLYQLENATVGPVGNNINNHRAASTKPQIFQLSDLPREILARDVTQNQNQRTKVEGFDADPPCQEPPVLARSSLVDLRLQAAHP